MSLTFSEATLVPTLKALENLRSIMQIGAAHAKAKQLDESELLAERLFADMFDLKMQVMATMLLAVHQGVLRIVDASPSPIQPEVNDFGDIDALIATLIADVAGIDHDQFDAAQNQPVVCALPIGEAQFTSASEFMLQWTLPHLYFHVATAYDILRHQGVKLAKKDYLGSVPMTFVEQPA